MSEGVIDHFSHHHPLHLIEALTGYNQYCSGCRVSINRGDTVYRCPKGCWFPTLHEECAEMPQEIRVSMHPQHTLIQKEVPMQASASHCPVCQSRISKIGYCCTSSSCEFIIHVGCAQNFIGVTPICIMHPSHPEHILNMLWRPGGSCLSRCDACGTKERGNSYICIDCQYWIHESCASLPVTVNFHHHHHPLSLVFHLPLEYIRNDFKCQICLKDLLPRYWAYHCRFCSYVVHIQCVAPTINRANIADEVGFPLKNSFAEVIGNFVTNVVGATTILDIPKGGKHKFQYHDHKLHLIAFDDHEEVEEEEEKEDSCDDDLNYRMKSELICDGCTTPILINKSPPPSSNKHCNYYMSCGECRYFLHVACFHLPPELPFHPLHPELDHNLTLQTTPKLKFTPCHICHYSTNGLFYACTKCDFKADIKCASLPNTIKHAAHPQHRLALLDKETMSEYSILEFCIACGCTVSGEACYVCSACDMSLHSSCALLPAVVRNPEWDKHPLPLTFDARADHPGDFYCDICEEEMNPRSWMYHCCDVTVHPGCFPTASGKYRNIKFGQQYLVAPVHRHPLRYQLLTTKLHCDVCSKRKDYGCRGFLCVSDQCGFFMCSYPCGSEHEHEFQAVD